MKFLAEVKSGKELTEAPVYSHFHYDIIPDDTLKIERPDILIVEGLNVLQPARLPKNGDAVPYVSDFFDFSLYIDADPAVCENWYITRFDDLLMLTEHALSFAPESPYVSEEAYHQQLSYLFENLSRRYD